MRKGGREGERAVVLFCRQPGRNKWLKVVLSGWVRAIRRSRDWTSKKNHQPEDVIENNPVLAFFFWCCFYFPCNVFAFLFLWCCLFCCIPSRLLDWWFCVAQCSTRQGFSLNQSVWGGPPPQSWTISLSSLDYFFRFQISWPIHLPLFRVLTP
jgi:hypothetical protein